MNRCKEGVHLPLIPAFSRLEEGEPWLTHEKPL
jgi:hypothetical protein